MNLLVLSSWSRALGSVFQPRMLVLSVLPLIASLLLWGLVLALGMQALFDWLQAWFSAHDAFSTSSGWLGAVGLGFLKTVAVPMLAILILLPLMVLSTLIFIGVAAMPAVVRHAGERFFPTLEQKQGGSVLGSVKMAFSTFGLFMVLWCASLPLYVFPPAALFAHVLLWGWMTKRVFCYDALANHASVEEASAIAIAHRIPLLSMGVLSGLLGAVPGLVWIGGAAISIALFPLLAALSVWLYVMIFLFTGLWFTHYCLSALAMLRR